MSGALLVAGAVAALIWANSPWQHSYHALWEQSFTITIGKFSFTKTFHHLINDGLMAVFFFVVGLEIKRELVRGDLSSLDRALMPIIAALGGMIAPALIYVGFTYNTPFVRGWGIPMATDIAFALAVLALLGKRIPAELRILLLGIAIVDDIGSILVIAVFYTEEINFVALLAAAGVIGAIVLMQRMGFRAASSYVAAAALLWLAALKSGVHATLAGVALGAITPLRASVPREEFPSQLQALNRQLEQASQEGSEEDVAQALGRMEELARASEPPLERAERLLHPWVTILVLPLFALSNSGITLSREAVSGLIHNPIALGIAAGLVLGKTLGISGFALLAGRLGLASLPGRVGWKELAGTSMVAGVGFTVSLFIAGLSFSEPAAADAARASILFASLVAAILGYCVLRAASPQRARERRSASAM
jgi:NhaA family Na+:H+ antiporter